VNYIAALQSVLREIRPLLRDYVEMLLYTGMRHGTEAMGIRWRDIEWHTDKGVRYLRIWVDGKTGGRWLIAKHKAVDVLKRLHSRQKDVAELSFETTLESRVPHLLFRFSDGHQPHSQALDEGFRAGTGCQRGQQDALFIAAHLRHFGDVAR